MREGAATVAVAERPDAGHVRGEPVVNFDVPSRIRLDTSRFESKVVSVWATPHGKQDVRANRRGLTFLAVDADLDAIIMWCKTDALCARSDLDTLVHQNLSYRFRDLFVLARDETRRFFNHRHLCTEAAVHLREFQSNVAATDDDQVLR
jgi:hypothetical protein